MNTKKLFLIITIYLISSISIFSFEKVGTTSFQFLKVITTARAAALAGAYSTISNSSDAVFWNPSALSKLEGINATVGYANWFIDIAHYSFSVSYTVEGIGTFGFLGLLTDVGEIEETKVSALGFVNGVYNPGLTGKIIEPRASVFGLSFGKALNDRFSFGLTVKYAREDLVYESADAIIFDGGFIYNTAFKSIVIGATLRHFGPDVKFIDESYPLPQTFNIGISSYLLSPDDPLITTAGNHSLLLSYDLIQPRDYDQQHSVGLEYSFDNIIFLRGGYLLNSDQERINAGVGINYKGYKIDYAFSDYGEYLDSVHRVSIGLGIN
ncbi:PorV/PorQ family protein [Bacteroidota bacterium]